jgi:hypothetical protein
VKATFLSDTAPGQNFSAKCCHKAAYFKLLCHMSCSCATCPVQPYDMDPPCHSLHVHVCRAALVPAACSQSLLRVKHWRLQMEFHTRVVTMEYPGTYTVY